MDGPSLPAASLFELLDALGQPLVLANPEGTTVHASPAARAWLNLPDRPWPPLDQLAGRATELGLSHRTVPLSGGWALLALSDDENHRQALRVALHDLRSPLANVRTYAALIGRGKLIGEKLQQSATVIARNADRALERMTDFVEAELALQGSVRIEPQATGLRALAQRALAAQPTSEEEERDVELQLLPGDEVYARADPEELARALSALWSRAQARSPHGQPVRVQVRAAERAEIDIRASGGPPQPDDTADELHARIARNRRLSPATELFLAHQIIRAHGGRLELRAEPPGVLWRITLLRA